MLRFFLILEKNNRVIVKEIDLEETERIDGGKEDFRGKKRGLTLEREISGKTYGGGWMIF